MELDMKKRRRQAAWICFEPYLSQMEKIQAIQILEQEFQIDGAIHLLAYVAKICLDFGINLKYRNKLYEQFEALLVGLDDNAIDPLFVISNNPSLIKEPSIIEPSVSTEKTTIELEVHVTVFIMFIRYILDYCPDKLELFTELFDITTDPKSRVEFLIEPVTLWMNDPYNFNWSYGLSQSTLTNLVHLVYTSLCEMLGPVTTDDYFHKALKYCEHQPESRLFSATQFL